MSVVRFEVDILDNAGDLVATLDPAGDLRWSYVMKEPGDLWCSFSMFHPQMSTDLFRPKINDFVLNMIVDESIAIPLMSGIVDSVNFKSELGVVEMTGKDYLMWLDQPYPLDAYDTYTSIDSLIAGAALADWSNGAVGKEWAGASGATQEVVVNDLIAPLLDPTYSPDTPVITLAFNGSAWSQAIDWRVVFGDSTSVLDQIRAISDVYDPLGFDFWMEWDKTLRLEGPRLINPAAVTPLYAFTSAATIVDIDWTNRGPFTTDVFGYGSGSGNVRGFARKTDVDNVAQFRRWRSIVNFQSPSSDLTSDNLITELVESGEFLEPQKELRLTVRPDFIDGSDGSDGFLNILGEAVDVDYTMPGYHRIDANFYVVGQTYYSEDGSNFLLDYTLAQVY